MQHLTSFSTVRLSAVLLFCCFAVMLLFDYSTVDCSTVLGFYRSTVWLFLVSRCLCRCGWSSVVVCVPLPKRTVVEEQEQKEHPPPPPPPPPPRPPPTKKSTSAVGRVWVSRFCFFLALFIDLVTDKVQPLSRHHPLGDVGILRVRVLDGHW